MGKNIFIADNRRFACEAELSSTSQANLLSIPGTDYDSAINVHICGNGVHVRRRHMRIRLKERKKSIAVPLRGSFQNFDEHPGSFYTVALPTGAYPF